MSNTSLIGSLVLAIMSGDGRREPDVALQVVCLQARCVRRPLFELGLSILGGVR